MAQTQYSEEFEKAYKTKFDYFYGQEMKRKEVELLQEEYGVLRESITYMAKRNSIYPMILGNSFYRISITNIGTFPPYKYTSELIYPMNFTSKKNYKPHVDYQKGKKDKILYVCSIGRDGPEITAEDGKKWTGDGLWEEFSKCIDKNEYRSFEEFSGLNYTAVIKIVENIGDLREFSGYIPFKNRNK